MINVHIIFQILMFFITFLWNVRLNKLIFFSCLHNFDDMIPFEKKSLFMLLMPQFIY
jgi:hypothetical protein